jgi:protease-4
VKLRNVSRAEIEDGRIIRGEEAVKIGLVDRLGNLHEAIEDARSLARSGIRPSASGQPS